MKVAQAEPMSTQIGSMTLKIETFVTKPIMDNPDGNFHTYGWLLNQFIVEQTEKGSRIMGFEVELSNDAANSLTDAVHNGSYYD